MRRSLVLTDESARHPFRASLPPHIRSAGSPAPAKPARKRSWMLTRDDLGGFLSAYFGCFVAVSIFIG
ncbi:hypothetical protein [Pseudopontixanthobacter vadosimaris]|uniref:hypothetical protein n=1 Tax=Pseudopontixanthobacter vadosimaris TaxID=2726450 RepID=UPI001474B21E|nr:hypothetical protein [Pseudopontixanthobacter vadosimaris]